MSTEVKKVTTRFNGRTVVSKSNAVRPAVRRSEPVTKHVITITKSNLDKGSVNLGGISSFFPASATKGKDITIYATGLDSPIVTDIVAEKTRFRKSFYSFFRANKLKAGDKIVLWKISNATYIAHPFMG